MQAMAEIYDVPVGVSDHTLFADHENYEGPLAHVAPVEAVKLSAKLVEVHLTLDRTRARTLFEKGEGGFDWPDCAVRRALPSCAARKVFTRICITAGAVSLWRLARNASRATRSARPAPVRSKICANKTRRSKRLWPKKFLSTACLKK